MTSRPSPSPRFLAALVAIVSSLAGCQLGAPSDALSLKSKNDPTDIMVAVGKAAQTCWFKSKDRAFTGYRLADEVNSPAGRPRLLLVPRRDPGALPALVIQAETRGDAATGTFSDVQAYGPLLSSPHGKRITDDVRRWAGGDSSCT